MDNVFSGLSLIIVIGAAVALIMRLINQPLIIGHIITGIIVGPVLLHVVKSPDTLAVFSDIGIALLLFIIGLGLNPKVIQEVGKVASTVGIVQVALTTSIGWAAAKLLGIPSTEALVLGIAFAFSSTIITLKLLSDKREQSRLYGKIAIGILLVQDLIAAVALLVVISDEGQQTLAFQPLLHLAAKGLGIVAVMLIITNKLLPKIHKFIADSQEFLFLFAIAWGFGSAALFAKIGFSLEIGALVAGISLAPLAYAQEIGARLRPLRDFFVIVFFITLGAGLSFSGIRTQLPIILIGSLIVVLIKPLLVLSTMGLLGYTKRTSFKSAVALAQVSEFSIIFVVLAAKQELVSPNTVVVLTCITLISIAISTYLIIFSDKLFLILERHLSLFERSKVHHEQRAPGKYELILFGYQKGGHEFVRVFQRLKKNFVVVDYDPEVIDILESHKISHIYGDATDIELLEEAGAMQAKLVVSTITDFETSQFLLKTIEAKNPSTVIITQADNAEQAAILYGLGASYVILPHYIGGEKIGAFIRKSGLKKSAFKQFRERHLEYLEAQFGVLEAVAEEEPAQLNKKFGRVVVDHLASVVKSKP